METYRIIKTETGLGPFDYNDDFQPLHYQIPVDIVTWYEVQVRGFFLWHTIKAFRSLRKAAELLHHLREPEEYAQRCAKGRTPAAFTLLKAGRYSFRLRIQEQTQPAHLFQFRKLWGATGKAPPAPTRRKPDAQRAWDKGRSESGSFRNPKGLKTHIDTIKPAQPRPFRRFTLETT